MSQIKSKFAPTLIPFAVVNQANGVAGLDGTGKILTAQLPAGVAGGLNFKGNFDASAGSYPSSPSNGDLYITTVAGTVSGVVYTVGDLLFYTTNGNVWQKIETSRSTDELPEGTTNLYSTPARIKAAAVVNSLTGSATDQAPSVAAVAAALAAKANSFTRKKERFSLSSTDISNGYVILSQLALSLSLILGIQGNGLQEESIDGGTTGDYVVSTDSGTGKTKVTWRGDLASGGATPLAAGDVIFVQYAY